MIFKKFSKNLKSKIRIMLREAERKTLETVAHSLCETLEIKYCNNFYQYEKKNF